MPISTFRYENGFSKRVNLQTDNYTLDADDNGCIVVINSATGKTVTVPNTLPVGFYCSVFQMGAGQITFAVSSTTIRNRQSHTKTSAQYARVVLEQFAADVFVLSGDTAA